MHVSAEDKDALVNKLKEFGLNEDAFNKTNSKALDEIEKGLTPEEQRIMKTLKGRRMVRPQDLLNIDSFSLDSIDGLKPRLKQGQLGLVSIKEA